MNLLFVNPIQFGYSAGYYHYCKHLIKKGHKIDFICLDKKLPKVDAMGVNVIYVSESKLNWRVSFLHFLKRLIIEDYNIIFLYHEKFAFLFRLFGIPYSAILDIRTGDLSSNRLLRYFWNKLIKLDTLFFKDVTILSKSLLYKLRLNPDKCSVLPLGADIISSTNKQFDIPRLLYVGTFFKRNIPETIKGVSLFLMKNPSLKLKYEIIGFGSKQEESEIEQTIINENLKEQVVFHGRKNYTELQPFFNRNNIGISYIPITPYFDCQPPTKTFEYILSGMICIATNTTENRILIKKENGLLCNDGSVNFCDALDSLYKSFDKFNSNDSRNSLLDYQWSQIIDNILEPLFFSKSN